MSSFKNYKRSIIFECDYNQLKQATPDITKQMSLLNAEFRKASEEVKLTGSELDKLGLLHEKLSTQIELQSDKVSGLKRYIEELNNAEGDNSKAITNKTIELKNAEATLARYKNELETTTQKIENFNRSIATTSEKLALLDAEFKLQQASVEGTADQLQKLIQQQGYYEQKAGLQKGAVEQVKNELDKLTQSEASNEKAITKKRKELKEAETALVQTEKKLTNVSKELQTQNKRLVTISQKWEDFDKKLSNSGIQLDTVASDMQKIGAAMVGIGVVSATMSMSFNQEFVKVKTIADETQVSFENLRKGALDVSSDINVDAKVAANALYEIVSANISTSDSLEVLESSAKLAKAGFTEVNTAADLLTTVLNGYGEGVDTVNKYSDQMILTQKLAKTTIGELGDNFGKVAGFAATANVEFAQIGSALTVLTTRGTDTSEAITALKAILSGVISPTQEAKKMAEELGIEFNLASLQSKGFAKFLRDIAKACKGNDEAISSLFGSAEALNAVLQLTSKEGMAQFGENLEIIRGASGETEKALEAMKTPGEELNKAFNELKNSLIEAGDSFSPIITMISGFISIIAQAPPSIVTTIAVLGSLAVTIGTVIKSINSTMSAVNSVSNIMDKLSGGLSPLEMKMLKIGGAILAAVVVLTAFLALWGALTGKGGEIESTMNGVSNSINTMTSNIGNMQNSAQNATRSGYAIGTEFVKEDGYYDVGEQGKERVFLRRGDRVANDVQTMEHSKGNNERSIIIQNAHFPNVRKESDLIRELDELSRRI